jgi:NitT/TauT family transport system substrate-binding protein
MEESPFIEELTKDRFSRRELLKRGAVAGVGVTALAGLSIESAGARSGAAALDTVRWVTPRGTLEVMDDYNIVIPMKMGYFKKLGIQAKLFPGDATGNLPQIAAGQYDMGYASPGVLTASLDAGVPVVSIWSQIPGQVFDFVLPADSKITHPRQLKGKTISIHNAGWIPIVNPMLAEVGVDPKTVKYREFGGQWNQAVALKLVDAGLSWEGLRAQLNGMATVFGAGFNFKFLVGQEWGSKLPSNSYQVRTEDLDDPKKVDIYTRFLTGVVMGFEFARANPRAAAQITYEQYPGLQKVITPQVALDSLLELHAGYSASRRNPPGQYGFHYTAQWDKYLGFIAKFGQTKKRLDVGNVLSNDFVRTANAKADKKTARRDALAYQKKLTATFRTTTLPKNAKL